MWQWLQKTWFHHKRRARHKRWLKGIRKFYVQLLSDLEDGRKKPVWLKIFGKHYAGKVVVCHGNYCKTICFHPFVLVDIRDGGHRDFSVGICVDSELDIMHLTGIFQGDIFGISVSARQAREAKLSELEGYLHDVHPDDGPWGEILPTLLANLRDEFNVAWEQNRLQEQDKRDTKLLRAQQSVHQVVSRQAWVRDSSWCGVKCPSCGKTGLAVKGHGNLYTCPACNADAVVTVLTPEDVEVFALQDDVTEKESLSSC
jgi:hypothetical protein